MWRYFQSITIPGNFRRMRDAVSRWLGSLGATRLPPDPPPLLLKRLDLLGLDPKFIAAEQPALLRGLSDTCSNCAHTEACAADLAANNVAAGMDTYCANGDTIDDLVIQRANG